MLKMLRIANVFAASVLYAFAQVPAHAQSESGSWPLFLLCKAPDAAVPYYRETTFEIELHSIMAWNVEKQHWWWATEDQQWLAIGPGKIEFGLIGDWPGHRITFVLDRVSGGYKIDATPGYRIGAWSASGSCEKVKNPEAPRGPIKF
jgi:hypothetical protein